MKPEFYLDINLRGQSDLDIDPMTTRNAVFSVLHGAFRAKPKIFALALPKGQPNLLRVFATYEAELVWLIEAISSHWKVRDYAKLSNVRAVGEHAGNWSVYSRFRIPTAKSDRNATQGVSNLRDRRLEEAETNRLAFFKISSASNRQSFTVFVNTETVPKPDAFDAVPDGYGLSRAQNRIALPDL